jgi:hypothetical protein
MRARFGDVVGLVLRFDALTIPAAASECLIFLLVLPFERPFESEGLRDESMMGDTAGSTLALPKRRPKPIFKVGRTAYCGSRGNSDGSFAQRMDAGVLVKDSNEALPLDPRGTAAVWAWIRNWRFAFLACGATGIALSLALAGALTLTRSA